MSKIEFVDVMRLNWDYRQKYFDFLAKAARLGGSKIRCLGPHFSNCKWNLVVRDWKQLLKK